MPGFRQVYLLLSVCPWISPTFKLPLERWLGYMRDGYAVYSANTQGCPHVLKKLVSCKFPRLASFLQLFVNHGDLSRAIIFYFRSINSVSSLCLAGPYRNCIRKLLRATGEPNSFILLSHFVLSSFIRE